MKSAILGVFLLLLCGIASAQSGTDKIAEGNNTFALSLYRTLSSGQEENLFFSPYSISTAFAMAYLGARGDTAREMAGTLHFTLPQETFHSVYGELIRGLNKEGQQKHYELVAANRLWGQTGYHFLTSFLDGEEKYYGAAPGQLDFSREPEKSGDAINRWVQENTHYRIKDLMPPGMSLKSINLVITSAIYFKSEWEWRFSRNSTADEPFHLNSRNQVTVSTMRTERSFKYGRFDDMEMIELPYRQRELSMVIILPKNVEGLAKVEKTLDYSRLKTMQEALKHKKINLFMPRFRTTSSLNLTDTLRKMGLKAPFESGRADFSGMDGTKKLYLSAILHKAFVEVNEEGTEAAATTFMGARKCPGNGRTDGDEDRSPLHVHHQGHDDRRHSLHGEDLQA